ncbi:MAG: T9SS type A sorting domain-containing protein [Bacteroidetes bacterium]|nr:T9SS type A sorting domain-containing protein [Bacteroidota bacterium]
MKRLWIQLSLIIFALASFAQTEGWTYYDATNSSIPFDKVFYLEFDHNGNLWGGTSVTNQTAHLFMFDGVNFINHNSNKWVYDIKVDVNGNIWTLNSNSELSKFDGTSWTDIKNSDLGWYSSPLYIDENDNKWANPFFSGTLLKYDGTSWTTYNNANTGNPDNKITCINGTGQDIYFGTNDSGLIHFDGSNWSTLNSSNSQLPNSKVYVSCLDQHDSLWMVCAGGYVVAMKDNNWSIYQNALFDVLAAAIDVDSKGSIWIAQSAKILKIDGSTITEYSSTNSILPEHSIITLKIDNNDKVWLGSRFGLYVYQDKIDTSINITSQPQSATIKEGEFVKFEIEAEGESLTYQWQKDGVDIKYASLNNYQIAAGKIEDAGKYSCIVKNAWGQVESDKAELIVNTGSGLSNINSEFTLNIFPNPSSGKFTIEVNAISSADIQIEIWDIYGRFIKAPIRKNSNYLEIDLGSFSKGTYLIKAASENSIKFFSVVIQ